MAALALQQIIVPIIITLLNVYYLVVGNIYIYGIDSYAINGVSSHTVASIS
jgi:hypothetical protein